ncbi:MAG: ChaN family lipoprotein [Bacteroidia bacterium]|nr:ChaN family lipoprotein [Bacteroidia bacterium]
MKSNLLIILATVLCLGFIGDKPAYTLFNRQGIALEYSKMIAELATADIVFIGELHDNPIAHWMELEITKDLYEAKKENTILGAEMFEADNQLILDEYLSGAIAEKKFEDEARLWPNYKTDYKPLVKIAKEKNLRFIATNIPRRYASVVLEKGFEGLQQLSDDAKKYFAPLPMAYDANLNCYKKMLDMGSMPMGKGSQSKMSMDNLPKAQAAKDATMAHFILKNWSKGKLFIHYNGSYHSDNFESILWHIKQKNKDIKILTVSTVLQDDIATLKDSNKNVANFIICIPESMTRTY